MDNEYNSLSSNIHIFTWINVFYKQKMETLFLQTTNFVTISTIIYCMVTINNILKLLYFFIHWYNHDHVLHFVCNDFDGSI